VDRILKLTQVSLSSSVQLVFHFDGQRASPPVYSGKSIE
jgi:hypothetical protein